MPSRRRLRPQPRRRTRHDNTAEIAQAVAEQIVAILPNLVAQITQAMNNGNSNGNRNRNGNGNREEAIELNAALTDNHVKAGTLTRKGEEKTDEPSKFEPSKNEPSKYEPSKSTSISSSPSLSEVGCHDDLIDARLSSKGTTTTEPSSSKSKKQKVQNYATTTPAAPILSPIPLNRFPALGFVPVKKPYAGTYPQCNTCKFHHPANVPCRLCTNCGRYGHLAGYCRANHQQSTNQANRNMIQTNQAPHITIQGPICYKCGDPGHFRNHCPRLALQLANISTTHEPDFDNDNNTTSE